MSCKKCKLDKQIVNKHYGLCLECNNERLHGSKFGKQYTYLPKKFPFKKTSKNKSKKSLFSKKFKEKEKDSILKQDEDFYKKCFDSVEIHKCEECRCDLPEEFRDEEGKIIARFRYSHIIAKSIAPELRHKIENINHLCLVHHSKWDHGDKKSMKIYKKNKNRFPNRLE